MNDNINNREGYLYITGTRGYSAYEVAVQNGFVGTEEEWLESLVGPQGPLGPEGKSAYQVAVENGYEGTVEDWVNDFLSPDGYYNKTEIDNKIVDNLESEDSDKVLSANQGKILNGLLDKKPYYFNTVAEMKNYNLKTGDYAITKGYYEENDQFGNSYLITKGNLFDINNTTKVNAYYNSTGQQQIETTQTSFLGIELPLGDITISSNKNLNKLIGFTSDDFSSGTVLTSPNIGREFTFNNDGTYRYFGFYCPNSTLIGLEVMMNTGSTAEPYKIYQEGEVLNNGLSAIKIINYNVDKSFISESIEIQENIFTDEFSKTKYWITKIPRYDENGNINELKLGFANDENRNFLTGSTAREYSNLKNATVCINAGVSYAGSQYQGLEVHGLRVLDHEMICNSRAEDYEERYQKTHWALGITDDGLLVSFGTINPDESITQSYEESQSLGCKYVTCGFLPIMKNGISQKNIINRKNQWVDNYGNDIYYQRQVIGQNTTTKDIYILTSNGKGTRYVAGSSTQIIDKGLTLDSCISILQSLGCDFAYQLDEGGSTSLIYRGMLINDVTDASGKRERVLSDFLYVEKKILSDKDKDIAELQTEVGNLRREIKDIKNKLYCNVDSDYPFEIQRWENGSLKNALNLRSSGFEYYDFYNDKQLFGIDANGLITNQIGTNGMFAATAKGAYDSDSINRPYSNIFIYPNTQADAPYSTVNGLVLSFVLWDNFSNNQMIQLAIPHAANPVADGHKPKYRTKTRSGDDFVWSNWFDIG